MVKIAVGMSGGVDSSVTAAILKEQGYELTGVFIEAYNEPGCRTDQDKKDALKVALKLDIPFQVLDVREQYKEKVVDYFVNSYKSGITPNPDIVCNREVKFGIFYDWAMANGFEGIATGHYARITLLPTKAKFRTLQRGKDSSKDQSYFLWQVPADHLPNIIWPLGDMYKTEVRDIAKKLHLQNADKPDSMGLCMMGELNVREFLKQKLGENQGEVVMQGEETQVIGTHRGLWFYTIGQRAGFEIDKKKLREMGLEPEKMEPLYVISKDKANNRIAVGVKAQVYTSNFVLGNLTLRMGEEQIKSLIEEGKLFVRIRNLGELVPVSKLSTTNGHGLIETGEPIMGVAEGQAGVIYLRDKTEGEEIIIGGGEIFPSGNDSV